MGGDLVGEVAEVSSAVTGFKVGDRIMAGAIGNNRPSRIYQNVPFRSAPLLENTRLPSYQTPCRSSRCIHPNGLSKTAHGSFHKDFLALDLSTTLPPEGMGGYLSLQQVHQASVAMLPSLLYMPATRSPPRHRLRPSDILSVLAQFKSSTIILIRMYRIRLWRFMVRI